MASKELTEEGADNLLAQLDTAYRRVEESQGSRVKLESAEINLLKVLEQARDMLTTALMASADRAALKEIFGGSCRRTGRIRAVLDAAQFTSERVVDPRLMGCRNACESVEQVLRDLGLGAALRAAQVAEREALAKEKAMIASTRTPPKAPPGGEDAAAAAAAAAAAKVAEEADRLAHEEAARKVAEAEDAAKKAAAEEAARAAALEAAEREAAKEEAARTAAVEAARRAAEEQAARIAAAEEAARRLAEETKARRAEEEEAARRLAEETAAAEAARRAEEEEAVRRAAAEDAARKTAEEAARREAEARAAEIAARKASEEEARKRREEEVHPKGKGGKGKGKAKGKHPGPGAEICTPARPLCHAEKVPLCKIGCGRQVAPGVTRHGKPFDTCCRGCALGAGHDDLCGKINPSKVGPGKCKMGCGLDAAKGRDSSGWALDTCCRGCATGEGHDGKCGKDVGDREVPYTTIDPSESFYRMAKVQLPAVQYNQLVQEIRELNRKSQSLEECHRKCSVLIGDGKEELLLELRRLLAASSVR
ncbi:TIC214, partial [Symbiodinium sp. CCMP2456]